MKNEITPENALTKHYERCLHLLELIKKCNKHINTNKMYIEIEDSKSRLNAYLITPKSWYIENINKWLYIRRRLWDWHNERLERINKIIS